MVWARRYAAAPNHDVATTWNLTWCRYAAQVRHTRPKLLYETQVRTLRPASRCSRLGHGCWLFTYKTAVCEKKYYYYYYGLTTYLR